MNGFIIPSNSTGDVKGRVDHVLMENALKLHGLHAKYFFKSSVIVVTS